MGERALLELVDREEEAAFELIAIRRNPVDLAGVVCRDDVSAGGAMAAGSKANRDNVVLERRPFALDAQQPIARVEDEVAPRAVQHRAVDVYPEFHGGRCDPQLGQSALLARRELHVHER